MKFLPQERIVYRPQATVYIVDYNSELIGLSLQPLLIYNAHYSTVVVQQKPITVLDGLQNLLGDSELPEDATCNIKTTARSGVECPGLLTLELDPCRVSITVTTRMGTLSSRTMMAKGLEVVYDRNVSLQVVTVNNLGYYILELSLVGIYFPPTAIPLVCLQSMS